MKTFARKMGTLGIAVLAIAGLAMGCQSWQKKDKTKEKPAAAAAKKAEVKNIVETAMASDDLSTLVSLLKSADLVETLEGKGPFTVFAPSNEAFDKLGKEKLDDLKKSSNKDELRNLLLYHVVSGDVTSAKLADMSRLKTMEGSTVAVTKRNGKIYVGNAQVIGADMDGSNGVIHLVDKVLMPPAEK
jgi:uncharacterized surface protein with fasciclin (FAS1) repeats